MNVIPFKRDPLSPKRSKRGVEMIFVSVEFIRNNAPPAGWTMDAILHLLRRRGLDAEQVVNWCKHLNSFKQHVGYNIYYIGEKATERKTQLFLK